MLIQTILNLKNMADNVAITAGSGTTIAADDIAGVLHQRVKISQGADGSATDVSSAAPLQVTLANTGANATPVVVDLGVNNDVTLGAALPAGTNNIGDVDVASCALPTGASTLAEQQSQTTALQIMDDWDNAASDGASVSGDVAHDSADAGEPVKVGAKAIAALSGTTLVAAADRTNNQSDLDGALIVRNNFALGDLVNGNASNTDGTSTQVLAAGAAGVKHYITDVTITNTSASNIYVELKDNTTVKWTFPVPANGGVTHHFASPLGGTAATAWNFDPSAAATTIYCSVSGFKSKI